MPNKFIDTLLSRQSVKFVQAPGPDDTQLDLILKSAMCAPDHGKIQPWRFALIRGENIPKILDIAIQAGIDAGKPIADAKIEKNRKWLSKVPLMIALACAPDATGRIREEESKLSLACAVTNMQLTAHAMGFSSFWSTGLGTYIDGVGDKFGFDALDYRFMGFLALGTAIETPETKIRPDYQQFLHEWQAE